MSILLWWYKKYWCLSEAILKFFFSTLCITKNAHAKKKRKLKISPQPHTFIMHTHFDSLHINSLRETAWNIDSCIINVWSFTDVLPKIKTTTTKNNLVPKTTSLFLTKLHPLVTEKVAWHLSYIFFYLNIPGICTSEVSSFALFRFLDILKGCREKILSLGLPHCLAIKYFIKYAYH